MYKKNKNKNSLFSFLRKDICTANKEAFTLAEVLITLMVIGVVAALTIPALMQSYKDRQTVTAVLKAASTLTNAFKLTVADDGEPTEWFANGADNNGFQKFYNHLKYTKVCNSFEDGCYENETLKYLNNGEYDDLGTKFPQVILSDGSIVTYYHHSNNCDHPNHKDNNNPVYCGRIFYDINGAKEPNTVGRDIFFFALDKDGVFPDIVPGTNRHPELSPGMSTNENPLLYCDINEYVDTFNGSGCLDWILKTKNVNYLHCNNLTYSNTNCK